MNILRYKVNIKNMVNYKLIKIYIEGLAEVVLITSAIFLSTLFANDLLFSDRIKENPNLFAWMAVGGIFLYIISKKAVKEII